MSLQKKKILIIEDEQDISRVVTDYLTISGFEAMAAADAATGQRLINEERPDFIILDIMLPDGDGIALCRQIRDAVATPILLLSARGSDTDKVLGLGFGADDYMTKPFSLSELVARIHAHLRRQDTLRPAAQTPDQQEQWRSFGELFIDKQGYRVTVRGRDISMSAKEFELLFHLTDHPNRVFTKSQLLDAVWGYAEYGDENTISVYIRRLREKLERDPSNPVYLKTVWGVGYKFSTEHQERERGGGHDDR
ncbi:response regulator transcription factor [Paenibacillus sp. NPDC058071]|uniref:response regulator transcription factor n=1 Tax=Paenibacillus sp. NPDC058071 TaxID=3346326 RepID=UPI0036D7FF8A